MAARAWLCFVLLAVASSAQADVVATCGASEGWGYYVPGGASSVRAPEWEKDSISKGTFQLIRSGDVWDIVFTDSTGGTLSAKADGGRVLGMQSRNGVIVVHVLYEGTAETYVFWLASKSPTLSFSTARFAAVIPKHSLMVAQCRRGA